MKKLLPILFILLSASHLKASDTLTVRQVFNFNVGDTFDYKVVLTGYFAAGIGYVPLNTCYQRYIVASKIFSANNDTIYYNYTGASNCTNNDVMAIPLFEAYTNLDSNIFTYERNTGIDSVYDFNTNTVNNNYANSFQTTRMEHPQYTATDFLHDEYTYIEGHGCYSEIDSFDAGNEDDPNYPFYGYYSINLIYFSNGISSFGNPTPSYLLDGVNNIPDTLNIHLYPNPTTNALHLSITNTNQSNTQLILTNLLGQEVYSSPITQSETTHTISKLVSGIYTWRITTENSIIKTGKIIKE